MALHTILFTGHMIDKEGRKEPRFPPDKEQAARKAIMEVMTKQKKKFSAALRGIAGGACGGDIIFHEICDELGIQSEIYLALPPEQFIKHSVAFAGPQWIKRFHALITSHPVHILPDWENFSSNDQKIDDSIWEKANQWMLDAALINGGPAMTLIALWDRKRGDAGGGTEHMVKVASLKHAAAVIIDVHTL